MSNSSTTLLLGGILGFLVLVLVIIASFLFLLSPGKTSFVSLSPQLKWEINKDTVSSIDEIYRSEGVRRSVLVVLVPYIDVSLVDSEFGMDERREKSSYFAKWSDFAGLRTLTIYVHRDNWNEIDPKKRDEGLSYYLSSEIAWKHKISEKSYDKIMVNLVSKLPEKIVPRY